jgi:glycosyltransferase involved in cell wall biosynthesis
MEKGFPGQLDLLIVMSHYLPGYLVGGPVRSISNLVEVLGGQMRIGVVCSDRDFGQSEPYPNLRLSEWGMVGKAWVRYEHVSRLTPSLVRSLCAETQAPCLYLNSLWDNPLGFRILLDHRMRSMAKRVVMAPRGQLQQGAMMLGHARLKRAVAFALRVTGASTSCVWHSTAPQETLDIQRAFPKTKGRPDAIHEITNLPAVPDRSVLNREDKAAGSARFVFCSRVAEKKRTALTICAMAGMKKESSLEVIGKADSEAYLRQCQEAQSRLPHPSRVTLAGSLPHEQLMARLPQYDGFVLPTMGENYGHAIVEALGSGVPVILSPHTPWNSVEEFGAGFIVPDDSEEKLAAAMKKIECLSPEEHTAMRHRARDYFEQVVLAGDVVQAYRKLFAAP